MGEKRSRITGDQITGELRSQFMGEKRARITGDRITGELRALMGEIKRQKRERVVSVLYQGPISAVDAANFKGGIWGGLEKRSEKGVEEDVWGISKGDLGGD